MARAIQTASSSRRLLTQNADTFEIRARALGRDEISVFFVSWICLTASLQNGTAVHVGFPSPALRASRHLKPSGLSPNREARQSDCHPKTKSPRPRPSHALLTAPNHPAHYSVTEPHNPSGGTATGRAIHPSKLHRQKAAQPQRSRPPLPP